ncbi:MAG: ribonucleotide-diphosphate reductase subunit alpha [Coxiellaceae bacterium]|nr:ribonucleotide-diphosphate reductase subunit alpha [Coxiellaceae bacterium]
MQTTLVKDKPTEKTTVIPGMMYVKKRCGDIVEFNQNKILTAIKKAFLAIDSNRAQHSEPLQQQLERYCECVFAMIQQRLNGAQVIEIEQIQDFVEITLMREGEHQAARSYILYREQRNEERKLLESESDEIENTAFHVQFDDNQSMEVTLDWLTTIVEQACHQHHNLDAMPIVNEARRNLFDGISIDNVFKAVILSARTLIETNPNYSYVTANLLLQSIFKEVIHGLKIDTPVQSSYSQVVYQDAFKAFIQTGIELDILDTNLNDFDLDFLAQHLEPCRDNQFTYLGLQTLYDRYLIHNQQIRIELPQVLFMRVAMGLAHQEGELRNQRAVEFYRLLSSFDYMTSTPTLFNSGTNHPQLSSCYLTTVPDDLAGIYGAIKDNALLSKFSGGLGNDWTSVRSMGSHIKGTNGESLGVVPFLNVADATAIAVNQGGKRKGAVAAYLETWHLDIEEYLELRKNTGDDRRRTHDMNTVNWIPDLFMQRVIEDGDWTLFSPCEAPELHDLYGPDFTVAYLNYENKAKLGEIQSKTLSASTLWRKMLTMLFETGHPWLTFKDPCNLRSPQQHAGVIHSSNLCTEITLNTSKDEIAVCNLGSINLAQHIVEGEIDVEKLQRTIKTAIRMLDNVIDINYYSVPQARNSNLQHRPVGLGMMGFQDALYKLRIPYASNEAVNLADKTMELISYYAIEASSALAKERGSYESYQGSFWSQGILPIDSIAILKESRGQYLDQNTEQHLDWSTLRETVKSQGMRNSNVMAIAPTATISNICGVTQSIEPTYENLFVKSNLSGEFTVINPYLYEDLAELNLWDSAMTHDLKYYNGSVQQIDRIPDDLKQLYSTAFEVAPKWLIEAASRRQKWLDQAQSLNLYLAQPSGKKLDTMYKMAWVKGLKTTYYLRSIGASNTEKSTIQDSQLNAVQTPPKACSINDPDCEACQ